MLETSRVKFAYASFADSMVTFMSPKTRRKVIITGINTPIYLKDG